MKFFCKEYNKNGYTCEKQCSSCEAADTIVNDESPSPPLPDLEKWIEEQSYNILLAVLHDFPKEKLTTTQIAKFDVREARLLIERTFYPELSRRDAQIAGLKKDTDMWSAREKGLEEEIAGLKKTIDKRIDTINNLNKTIVEKSDGIKNLNHIINKTIEIVKEKNQTIEDQNKEIEELKTKNYLEIEPAIVGQKKEIDYWKQRCEAAENVIKVFPIVGHYFNTTDSKKETAYKTWQKLRDTNPK